MFSTGIGNTDAAFILGNGKLWVKVPESMCFEFPGKFPDHIMAKDVILKSLVILVLMGRPIDRWNGVVKQ
ncbi:MAG: hypothetical protein CM1200mP16_00880 [Nitrospina sp.]|nr:MAG: hypothetical protein CM1200mP16_00880 [Nitrospina sp.]